MSKAPALLSTALVFTLAASAAASPVVLKGSDYLQTIADTTFAGVPFQGVPIGPGNTDTIVQRKSDATFAGTGTSDTVLLELLALTLVSLVPFDFAGNGLDFYYLTLQSARGGPPSVGSMTINFNTNDDGLPFTPQGTFSSFFDVFFDIRKGSDIGPIVFSQNLILSNPGAPWDATPDPRDLIVPGVVGDQAANFHTNKVAGQLDFFPSVISEEHPSGATHTVQSTDVPEPGSIALLVTGLVGFVLARRTTRT